LALLDIPMWYASLHLQKSLLGVSASLDEVARETWQSFCVRTDKYDTALDKGESRACSSSEEMI